MPCWPVLVSLHNLVNIPPTACEQPSRKFCVEVKQVNTGNSAVSPQKTATSTFTAREVSEPTPRIFEIRLDEPHDGKPRSGCSCVWQCSSPTIDVVVVVTEESVGLSNVRGAGSLPRRVVGSSTTFVVGVQDIVEEQKLSTRIIGTEMGQVGLSFSVDPSDRAGYTRRLETFLRVHNPRGLHLVPNVVDVVPEVDTFTKLFRKYKVKDYDQRLRDFFAVYGPNFAQDIPSLVKQWEGREEELIRNLILDNGPELSSVNIDKRLTAFLTQYRLRKDDNEVRIFLDAHKDSPSALFTALARRFGPEPDPRNYLFPATEYHAESVSSTAANNASSFSHTTESPVRQAPRRATTPLRGSPRTAARDGTRPLASRLADGLNTSTGHSYLSLLGTTPVARSPTGHLHSPVVPTQQGGQRPSRSPRPAAKGAADGFYQDAVFDDIYDRGTTGLQRSATRKADSNTVAALRPGESPASGLWLRMMSVLRTSGHREALEPGFFFYCSQDVFSNLIDSLDAFSKRERDALLEEWREHCWAGLQEEVIRPADGEYDGTVAEATRVANLQPVQLQVSSLVSFRHREHYKYFAACLASAKDQHTERLALVGERDKLLDIARHGVGAQQWLSSGAGGYQGPAARGPAAVFVRRPFAAWKLPRSTCMLVCDVVVGRCHHSGPPPARLPQSATTSFLNQYDSSAFDDGASGPSLAVYSAFQVLPRYLVQCTVDPTAISCSSHPDRRVEYFVLNDGAIVCSRCVVVGKYKGREVLPIEEAATQAREKLGEMNREAESLSEHMLAHQKRLEREEEMIATAPRRLAAEKEIELLKREVEERITAILSTLEQEEEEQRNRIKTDCRETEAIQTSSAVLAADFMRASQEKNSLAVVQMLQRAQQEQGLQALFSRAQERLPNVHLEPSFPPHVSLPPFLPFRGGTENARAALRVPGASPSRAGAVATGARLPFSDSSSAEVRTPPKLPPAAARQQHSPRLTSSASVGVGTAPAQEDLLSKYQTLSSGFGTWEDAYGRRGHRPVPHQQPALSSPSQSRNGRPDGTALQQALSSSVAGRSELVDASRGPAAQKGSAADEVAPRKARGGAKESLTKGWALLHQGNTGAAAAEWQKVCAVHGEDDPAGAKARAYLCEAVEKDYEGAARWYARCLALDPTDRLTAYNYGVLLEALLRRPQEAIALYDKAAALGDQVAAARAQQLRTNMSIDSLS